MTRFWALIAAKRVHVFSLGKHENDVAAQKAAEDYCVKKNAEAFEKSKDVEGAIPPEYITLAVLDIQDMRDLPGEFQRPYEIPTTDERETVAVEPTKVLGGPTAPIELVTV